ncbi:MAG: hypothetical protein ACLRWH_09555 [Emergencia sp.]
MVEYRLVPLMVSVVKIGDELSAAVVDTGLGAPSSAQMYVRSVSMFDGCHLVLYPFLFYFLLQRQITFEEVSL